MMNIEIPTDAKWNNVRLTFIEKSDGSVLVAMHDEYGHASDGDTVKVRKADLVRAAQMLCVPCDDPEDQTDDQ